MKVTTTKGDLYVEFRHIHPEVATGYVKMSAMRSDTPAGTFLNHGDAGTYCTIKRDGRDGEIIAQGQSILHPLDVNTFNRSKGRKVSLAKTLAALFPGSRAEAKANREAVWSIYLNR